MPRSRVARLSAVMRRDREKLLNLKHAIAWHKLRLKELCEACESVEDWFHQWGVECGPAEETMFQRLEAVVAKAREESTHAR